MTNGISESGLRYREFGQSTTGVDLTFVLIHGAGGSINNFDGFGRRLGEKGRVIILELPGHGRSPLPQSGWNLDGIVSVLESSILEIVGRDHAIVLVGHSFGGLVCAILAQQPGLKVVRVVGISAALFGMLNIARKPLGSLIRNPGGAIILIAAAFTTSVRPPSWMCDLLNRSSLARRLLWPFINSHLLRFTSKPGNAFREQGGIGALRLLHLLKRLDSEVAFASLHVPLTFVLGGRDPLIGHDDRLRARRIAGEARVQTMQYSAHWPMIEVPSQLAKLEAFQMKPRNL